MPFYVELPRLKGDAADQQARADAQRMLGQYVNENATALCVIFGDDADASAAASAARSVAARKMEARVIWVKDPRVLDPVQTAWRTPPTATAVFLSSDAPRKVSSYLSAADAADKGQLTIAFNEAMGGV